MIKKLAAKIGIDKAIFYTVIARIFQSVGGVVSVLLIATFLTGVEQGFYYTFSSILAIQIFFELGLSLIITQYVAHEKAHLMEIDNNLTGSAEHASRVASLMRFCVKWYSMLAVGFFVVISVSGFVFFSYYYKSEEVVNWTMPWILLVLGTSINFILAPISSFLEGLGKIKEIAKMRFIQQFIVQASVWGGLIVGLKLYVVVFPPMIMAIILSYLIWRKFGALLKNIYRTNITSHISYRKEIFPYQWKVAVSWISGYFIFQIFNPVLFATEGAVVAGQMGMTLTVLNSIMSLSDSWFSTKVPNISGMIAKKEYSTLDKLFFITFKQSVFIVTGCVLIFIAVIYVLDYMKIELLGRVLAERFLSYIPVVVMCITIIMRQLQSGWAMYLRCHKQEPLMWVSVITSILCVLSTLILGKEYGVLGMTVGYAIITLCTTISIMRIFNRKRELWHRS